MVSALTRPTGSVELPLMAPTEGPMWSEEALHTRMGEVLNSKHRDIFKEKLNSTMPEGHRNFWEQLCVYAESVLFRSPSVMNPYDRIALQFFWIVVTNENEEAKAKQLNGLFHSLPDTIRIPTLRWAFMHHPPAMTVQYLKYLDHQFITPGIFVTFKDEDISWKHCFKLLFYAINDQGWTIEDKYQLMDSLFGALGKNKQIEFFSFLLLGIDDGEPNRFLECEFKKFGEISSPAISKQMVAYLGQYTRECELITDQAISDDPAPDIPYHGDHRRVILDALIRWLYKFPRGFTSIALQFNEEDWTWLRSRKITVLKWNTDVPGALVPSPSTESSMAEKESFATKVIAWVTIATNNLVSKKPYKHNQVFFHEVIKSIGLSIGWENANDSMMEELVNAIPPQFVSDHFDKLDEGFKERYLQAIVKPDSHTFYTLMVFCIQRHPNSEVNYFDNPIPEIFQRIAELKRLEIAFDLFDTMTALDQFNIYVNLPENIAMRCLQYRFSNVEKGVDWLCDILVGIKNRKKKPEAYLTVTTLISRRLMILNKELLPLVRQGLQRKGMPLSHPILQLFNSLPPEAVLENCCHEPNNLVFLRQVANIIKIELSHEPIRGWLMPLFDKVKVTPVLFLLFKEELTEIYKAPLKKVEERKRPQIATEDSPEKPATQQNTSVKVELAVRALSEINLSPHKEEAVRSIFAVLKHSGLQGEVLQQFFEKHTSIFLYAFSWMAEGERSVQYDDALNILFVFFNRFREQKVDALGTAIMFAQKVVPELTSELCAAFFDTNSFLLGDELLRLIQFLRENWETGFLFFLENLPPRMQMEIMLLMQPQRTDVLKWIQMIIKCDETTEIKIKCVCILFRALDQANENIIQQIGSLLNFPEYEAERREMGKWFYCQFLSAHENLQEIHFRMLYITDPKHFFKVIFSWLNYHIEVRGNVEIVILSKIAHAMLKLKIKGEFIEALSDKDNFNSVFHDHMSAHIGFCFMHLHLVDIAVLYVKDWESKLFKWITAETKTIEQNARVKSKDPEYRTVNIVKQNLNSHNLLEHWEKYVSRQ